MFRRLNIRSVKRHHLVLAVLVVVSLVLVYMRQSSRPDEWNLALDAGMEEQLKWSMTKRCGTGEGGDCDEKEKKLLEEKQLATSKVLRFWKDRDPFGESYIARPLSEVLIEMSDYAGGKSSDWRRRKYLAEFAAGIIERDKDQPQVLKPHLVDKNPLSAVIPKVQPYFLYWNSGFDKAPHEVVQILQWITKASIKRMNETYEWSNIKLTLLDDANIGQYVQFPSHLIAKRSNYTNTYFSDLLRIELLCNYGGFWADSTFYFDKPMPRDVYESDLFAFKLWQAPAYSSSWFFHSYHKHNPLLLWVRHLMFEYWKTHNSHEYFDLHKFFEIVIQFFPELRPYYDTMPFYSSARAHSIHRMFNGAFNADRWTMAKAQSWGYKLSYKSKLNILPQLRAQAAVAKEYLHFVDEPKDRKHLLKDGFADRL